MKFETEISFFILNKSLNNQKILALLIFSKQCQIFYVFPKYPSHMDTSYNPSNYHRAIIELTLIELPLSSLIELSPIELPSTPSSSQIELIIELTHRAQNWDHPSSPSSSLSPNEFTHRALIESIELTVTEIEMTIYANGIFGKIENFGIVLKKLKMLVLFGYLRVYLT